jgi:hypothetical protein
MIDLTAVEAIFFAALEKPSGSERTAFLKEACGTDPEVRRHVERLLAAHPQAGSFLQPPAQGLGTPVEETPLCERLGTLIGP